MARQGYLDYMSANSNGRAAGNPPGGAPAVLNACPRRLLPFLADWGRGFRSFRRRHAGVVIGLAFTSVLACLMLCGLVRGGMVVLGMRAGLPADVVPGGAAVTLILAARAIHVPVLMRKLVPIAAAVVAIAAPIEVAHVGPVPAPLCPIPVPG